MYAENSMVSFQNLPCMTRAVELDIFFTGNVMLSNLKKKTEQTEIKVSWLIALYSLMTKVCFHSHWGTEQ